MWTSLINCRCLKFFAAFILIALATGLNPGNALAQVDNKTTPFQMEGNGSTDTTVCFLPVANGGPAFATPVAPGTNMTDGNGCPTVNPGGTATTWSLVTFGGSSEDWDKISGNSSAHALAKSFTTDIVNSTSDNAFLGTSSSLSANINTWTWNPHKPQGKDDIAHSMAAAYTLANGHIGIFAAMDRFDNSGSSIAGFLFVQDPNFDLCTGPGQGAGGPDPNCKATNTFVGNSTIGDLLILSAFTQGGAVSTIDVFKWDGSTMSLDLTKSPAPCDPTLGTENLCGVVNNQFVQMVTSKGAAVLSMVNTPSPWSFTNKGGQTSWALGEFIEIGVDLNSIFGSDLPCFTRTMALTSSSQTLGLNDSLSDLTAPTNFPLCKLSATKSCVSSQLVNGGPSVLYSFSGQVTNTGPATIYDVTISDAPSTACPDCGPPSGSTIQSLSVPNTSGGLASGGMITYTGTLLAPGVLGTGQKNKILATASSSTSGTPQNVDGTADWGDPSSCGPPISPNLTVNKKCESCLQAAGANGGLVVQVAEGVQVCNTGNDNISNINVEDCRGTPGPAPGTAGAQNFADNENDATCSVPFVTLTLNTGTTLGFEQNGTPTCGVASSNETPFLAQCTPFNSGTGTGGNCSFSDMVFVHGTAVDSGAITKTNSTSCSLCPINTSCPAITF